MAFPLVLLHGVGLDASIWDAVISSLAADGVHEADTVVALDLPGHASQPPLTEPTSLEALANDVINRVLEQTQGPVHLVGFSLGSLIAQHIAIHHPSLVATITCVSSVCARTSEESAAVLRRLEAAEHDFTQSARAALERWFPDGQGIPDAAALRARTEQILLANDTASYVHAYRVFAEGDQVLEPDLHRIHAPALAVTGEFDPGSTPDMSRRIAERIPHTPVHIVDGARHMIPDTHPDLLATLIRKNVARHADFRR